MGIMNKIENKLHSDKHQTTSNEPPLYSGSERRSIEQQSAPYGSGSGHSSSTEPNRTHDLRHPVQSATGSTGQNQYGSGTGSNNIDYNNDGYGDQSSRIKTHAHDPVDPRSIRGQNAIYDNSGRTNDGDYNNEGNGRSHHGGISNPMSNNNNYGSTGRSSYENNSSIPTAGGEHIGSGSGSGHHGHHDQSHSGRDAAFGAGAGALGTEAYERRHEPSSGRHGDQYDSRGMQARGQQDGAYPTYPGSNTQNDHSGSKHHGISHHNDTASGISSTEPKKLGGAYEAGYRDAMQHMEAERQRQL